VGGWAVFLRSRELGWPGFEGEFRVVLGGSWVVFAGFLGPVFRVGALFSSTSWVLVRNFTGWPLFGCSRCP
jgi:hypothetical protein